MSLSKRYLWLAASLVLLDLLPAEWLELQRRAVIDAAELWRLVTAHWSHVGLVHLALNALGVLVLANLFLPREPWRGWLLSLAIIALGVSLALMVTLPALVWYRGFSGCLYGLFIYEAIRHLKIQPWTAVAVLVLVVGKLAIDGLGFGGNGAAALIGAPVVDTAHVAGALTGGALALLRCLLDRSDVRAQPLSERHQGQNSE